MDGEGLESDIGAEEPVPENGALDGVGEGADGLNDLLLLLELGGGEESRGVVEDGRRRGGELRVVREGGRRRRRRDEEVIEEVLVEGGREGVGVQLEVPGVARGGLELEDGLGDFELV